MKTECIITVKGKKQTNRGIKAKYSHSHLDMVIVDQGFTLGGWEVETMFEINVEMEPKNKDKVESALKLVSLKTMETQI